MNDLEQYLRKATQGLPSAEKQRLAEELRGSVLERAAELQLSGLNEQQALKGALREFGDPRPLAAGMRSVHLWPKVGFFSALLMSMAAIGVLNWPRALGQQVQVTTHGVIPDCTRHRMVPAGAQWCTTIKSAWLDTDSLIRQLQQQHATVTQVTELAKVQVPGSTVQEQMLKVVWEENGQQQSFELPLTDHALEATNEFLRRQQHSGPEGVYFQTPPSDTVFKRGEKTFLNINTFSKALADSSTLPVSIENMLDAPILRIGRIHLNLGQAQQGIRMTREVKLAIIEVLGRQYQAQTYYGVQSLNAFNAGDDIFVRQQGFLQQVAVKGRPGEIYAVVYPVTVKRGNGVGFDLVTVGTNGQLKFRTAQKSVTFTRNIRALGDAGAQSAQLALLRLGNPVTFRKAHFIHHTVELPYVTSNGNSRS